MSLEQHLCAATDRGLYACLVTPSGTGPFHRLAGIKDHVSSVQVAQDADLFVCLRGAYWMSMKVESYWMLLDDIGYGLDVDWMWIGCGLNVVSCTHVMYCTHVLYSCIVLMFPCTHVMYCCTHV